MIPNTRKRDYFDATIDYTADTIKVALFKETTEYTPDPDNHDFVSDVFDGGTTGEEMTATNYSRQALGGKSTTVDDTDDEGVWDASNVTFPNLGADTGGEVIEAILIYRQTGGDDTTPSDDEILRILDDSEEADLPLQTNGGDVTIAWNSEGIINIT